MPLAQPPNTRKYEVTSSDTIARIALHHNTTPTELSRLNHLSTSLLYPGQTLFVPDKSAGQNSCVPDKSCEITKSTEAEQNNGLLEIPELDYIHVTEVTTLDKENMAFSPDKNLDHLLDNECLHTSGDEISRKYLKIKSKYVADSQEVVSGVLLVTPLTVMFNPCVSDHLVMEHGQEIYVVRLPLRAISRIILFEDIAAMVVGDMSKQYIPKVSFLDYTSQHNILPKRGTIECEEIGVRYALHGNFDKNYHANKLKEQENEKYLECAIQNLLMSRLQESTIFLNETKLSTTDRSIGSSNEQLSSDSTVEDITMTSHTSEPPFLNNNECTSCRNFSDFMEDSKLSSTPKHNKLSDVRDMPMKFVDSIMDTIYNTGTILNRYIDDKVSILETNLTTSNINKANINNIVLEPYSKGRNENVSQVIIDDTKKDEIQTNKKYIESDNSKQSACNKGSVITDEKISNSNNVDIPTNIDEQNMDITQGNKNKGNNIDTKLGYHTDSTCDENKDNRISELSSVTVQDPDDNESKDSPHHHQRSTLTCGSTLSDEARQWLGKRGVTLYADKGGKAHYRPGSPECDLDSEEMFTPRPPSKVNNPLMYVAIKLHKTYKPNQILGVSPNVDENRREHWFAVPRERVDQFYNFLLYWLPDVYGEDSSGFSTPCSSECENFEEKLKIRRSWSQYSDSSKSSTRSLGEDEIPDLQTESQILTRKQVHLLTRKLPSRTFGHCWELIYSTMMHGISLATLYRNFQCYDTPVLIVVKDENQKVFGAFMSETPKVSDGFYGTGESMLYSFLTDTTLKSYNWTGNNNFFIKGSKTSLAIGDGEGVFGLWLDEDLYRGRSHSCKTFGNETLSSCEDFICCGLEAWGFV